MSTPSAPPNPDYLASLGLQRAPFLDQIDDRFFYADPMLVQRLDLLQHLIQFGDMLLGVSGPAGSGKSTLLRQLLLRGATTWRSCRLNSGQLHQPNDLLTQLADGFGLDRNATPERLKTDLLRLCQTLRHNAQIAVIVIDDAQLLPDPVLKTLLELGGNPRETLKLLRVILFSEPGLEQRLTQAGWHTPLQPLLHNLDLPCFDDHQTAAYLMYRLAVAGYSGESPFSLTEIRALHKAAGGLPGRLNVLAHETLVERAGRVAARKPGATGHASPVMPRWPAVAVGMAAVVFLGGLGWFLTRTTTDLPETLQATAESVLPPTQGPDTTGQSETPVAQASATTPETVTEPVTPPSGETEPSAATDTAAPTDALPLPTPVTTEATAEPPQPANPAAVIADAESPATPADSAPNENAPAAPAPTETALANTPAPAPSSANIPTATAAPAPEPEPAPQPAEPGPGAAAAVAPATNGTADIAGADQTAPESSVTAPPAPAAPAASGPGGPAAEKPAATASEQLGTEWLRSRPGARFTLQLLGGRSEKSLREFLRQHRVPEPVATFHTVHKGDDWYVLVHGDFPTMAAARAAVASLPASVRRGKPWARSFASVQADMQKVRP